MSRRQGLAGALGGGGPFAGALQLLDFLAVAHFVDLGLAGCFQLRGQVGGALAGRQGLSGAFGLAGGFQPLFQLRHLLGAGDGGQGVGAAERVQHAVGVDAAAAHAVVAGVGDHEQVQLAMLGAVAAARGLGPHILRMRSASTGQRKYWFSI